MTITNEFLNDIQWNWEKTLLTYLKPDSLESIIWS